MAKKVLLVLLLILVLGAIALTVVAGRRIFAKPPLISTITSPDGILWLQLKGNPAKPTQPIIDHSVHFDLFRNGQPVLRDKYVHQGDWFDPGFNNLYRQHDWVTNSVIRFSWESVA